MKVVKIILIIVAVLIIAWFIFGQLPFCFSLLRGWGSEDHDSDSQIDQAIEEQGRDSAPSGTTETPSDQTPTGQKPIPSVPQKPPSASTTITPVPKELAEIKLDCKTEDDIPAKYRSGKNLCQNLYLTDGEKLKTAVAASKAERVILYGKYIIYNCPTHSEQQIVNLIDGCYETAHFLDGYFYKNLANIFHVSIPSQRLYIHFIEDDRERAAACEVQAAACFADDQNAIYLMLGTGYSNRFYTPSGMAATRSGVKMGDVTYWFNYVYPPNCPQPDLLLHEIIHYFDYLSYGQEVSWIEEAVARLVTDPIFNKLCPPGVTLKNVMQEENGKVIPLDSFDQESDAYIVNMLEKYWDGDSCRKGYFIQINRLLREQGFAYLPKLHQALREIQDNVPYSELTWAFIESAGGDPAVRDFLIRESDCPY